MERPRVDLLRGLLKDVSRSFYLTLRALPAGIRRQIGLAYLLARASDTIADTDAVPKDQRLKMLGVFRDWIRNGQGPALDLRTFAGQQSSAAERVLLQNLEPALRLVPEFEVQDRQRIREVLEIITGGQILDLERFAEGDADHVAALETDEQLDDYTYRVAGCVGEFWTHLCRAHLFPRDPLDEKLLLANGVRFGKGLQLVNILRDVPADLRLGRCYLPRQRLAELGVAPSELLRPENESRMRLLYDGYLDRAEGHLAAGWAYINQLPFRFIRVRLACAWPVLIGSETLGRLRTSPVLDARHRVKISRPEVRAIVFRSVVFCLWPSRWRRLFRARALASGDGARQNTLPPGASLVK
jgi:farnesyl-diphosphate farnesyltransferase